MPRKWPARPGKTTKRNRRTGESAVEAEKSANKEKQVLDPDRASDACVAECVKYLGGLDAQRILISVGRDRVARAGLATATKLKAEGARPTVLLTLPPDEVANDTLMSLGDAAKAGVPIRLWTPYLPQGTYQNQDLIIDAFSAEDGLDPMNQVASGIAGTRLPVLKLT